MLGDIRRILRKIDLLGFVLEDIFDLHEVVLAVTVGQPARGGQALRADLAGEAQNAGTDLIGLILIAGLLQYLADVILDVFVQGGGLLDSVTSLRYLRTTLRVTAGSG